MAIDKSETDDIIGGMEKTPKAFTKEFCNRLRAYREAKYPNQSEFARRIGITPTRYSKYERRSVLPVHFLPKVASLLGVSIDALFHPEADPHAATMIREDGARYGIDAELVASIKNELDRQIELTGIKMTGKKYKLAIGLIYERVVDTPSEAINETQKLLALIE